MDASDTGPRLWVRPSGCEWGTAVHAEQYSRSQSIQYSVDGFLPQDSHVFGLGAGNAGAGPASAAFFSSAPFSEASFAGFSSFGFFSLVSFDFFSSLLFFSSFFFSSFFSSFLDFFSFSLSFPFSFSLPYSHVRSIRLNAKLPWKPPSSAWPGMKILRLARRTHSQAGLSAQQTVHHWREATFCIGRRFQISRPELTHNQIDPRISGSCGRGVHAIRR